MIRVREMDLETTKRIGEKRKVRGQDGFYRNIIAHSSFRSSSLSSESIMLRQDPCDLCCLLIIPSQLLWVNLLHGSVCCGAEHAPPILPSPAMLPHSLSSPGWTPRLGSCSPLEQGVPLHLSQGLAQGHCS